MKRIILASAAWAFAACGAIASAPDIARAAPYEAAAAVLTLHNGWRFHQGDLGAIVAASEFDDASWEAVSLPHTWNRIGQYQLTRGSESDNFQGVGWYRLTFLAPPPSPRSRQYLDFAGVGKIADVWVNGIHVGRHEGAFARFRFDVTRAWRAGARNVIAVRADNSKPTADNDSGQVIPLSGDFFVNGGIYRGVSLITASDAGVDMLDFGGPGVYASVSAVSSEKASIGVLTRLRNLGKRPRKLSLTYLIGDAKHNIVSRKTAKVLVAPGIAESRVSLDLPKPHLWDGRADPYLYSVLVEIREGGQLTGTTTVPLGVRTFQFDANTGFSLNGRKLKLHGVSRHQDTMGKGWALDDADLAADMALIEEMGANTVRQAHYQHADTWTELADQGGMVVWAELPYVTTPSLSGGVGSDRLWANAEQQLREQIRQQFNHPSIFMWSVGNEVDSAKGFGVAGEPPKPLALLRKLNAVAKEEDPSRPSTFADCCEDLAMVKTAEEPLAGTTDLIGYNRYYGWYMPDPLHAGEQLGREMDRLHAKHPGLPISLSEYGAGGALSQHSDDIRSGFVNSVGRPQPEEFESFVHEQSWPALRSRDFVFASWIWNMFDFPSDLRQEGDAIDLNTKGLVSFDRKTRKDAFYYYKAQWNPEPMIHLNGKRYERRAYAKMDVRAYTNATVATLTLNGKVIGDVRCPDRVCDWADVALNPGTNHALVTANVNGTDVTDTAEWIGPNPLISGVAIDAGDITGRTVGGRQYGSDTYVSGGTPKVLNFEGFGHKAAKPRVVDTQTPELFEYWREGEEMNYTIPVPNGRWRVTLHLFDPSATAASGKSVSVVANGKTVLSSVNVAREAGGALKDLAKTFSVDAFDGQVRLNITGRGGPAALAAITIDGSEGTAPQIQ